MIRAVTLVVILAGLASGASARKADDDLGKALAGRSAGTPTDCVDRSRLGGPQIIDSKTLLYRESGRRIWRNDLESSCPGLRDGVTLVVDAYGSQMCRNDRFRTVEPGLRIPGPYCRFGRFTPYDKPKAR